MVSHFLNIETTLSSTWELERDKSIDAFSSIKIGILFWLLATVYFSFFFPPTKITMIAEMKCQF